ncbi:MAG: sulfotransferase, partial [Phycisphaerales bacterium]|nr:sulfotransferase [Phycisphaerales bacterium]
MLCVGGASSAGTTLVADLLDSVQGIGCPPELYVFNVPEAYSWDETFVANALARSPLANPSSNGLAHTWFNHKHLPSVGLDDDGLDRLIRSSDSLDDFLEGFRKAFERFRNRPIEALAEKTPINVNLAETWCDRFTDGLFIHVVRHPWSVISSLQRRGFSSLQAAMVWICQVEAGLRVKDRPNATMVRYEDITADPFEGIAGVVRRIGITTDASDIESAYRNNEYRASLKRVATWTAAEFDGEIHPATPPSSPADAVVLHRLGAINHADPRSTEAWLRELADELEYDLGEMPASDPDDLEKAWADSYAELVSTPHHHMLRIPVDPLLRRDVVSSAPVIVRPGSPRDLQNPRILHGTLGQAGQPSAIARAQRGLGAIAASCSLKTDGVFAYGCDLDLSLQRKNPKKVIPALARIARDFDVVHLYGSAFGNPSGDIPLNLDILFLRMMGVKVIWHGRGTDCRLEKVFRRLHPNQHLYDPKTFRGFKKPHAFRHERVLLRERVCNHVLAVDEEMRSYLPDAEIVRRAIDLEDWPHVGAEGDTPGRVVVVHAPSREIYKGTEPLEAAVAKLQAEGLPIDYRKVEGLSNDKAREVYKSADIVVDQLMIGWYGVLSVEAMALGKTVVAYIRPDLERHTRDLPIVNAGIDDIEARLRELVNDGERRQRLGQAARQYVETFHDSRVIARQLLEIYARPSRPLDAMDWPAVWDSLAALSGETQGRIKAAKKMQKT